MKYLITSIFLLSILTCGYTQAKEEYRSLVYTHDGSVFIGKILSEDDFEIKMQVVTNDIVTINKGLIHKLFRGGTEILVHPGGKMHFNSGFFFSTSFGTSLTSNVFSSEWDFIFGKRLGKQLSVGIGTSIATHEVNLNFFWVNASFVPIYGYGRYYLTHKKARIFGATKLGWGIPEGFGWEVNHKGGIHFQPSIGVHFASKKARRWVITLSQNVQKIKGTDTSFDIFNNPVDINYNIWMTRVMLKVGIEIH